MRRRYDAGDETPTVHINVVPLIDVMFFLVLFFVATASFVQDAAIDVNRPAARSGTVQERGNIVVAVTRAGEVFMAGRRVDIRSVRGEVERLLADNQGSAVVVAADADGTTAMLVTVLDQVREAGATNVAIATTGATGVPALQQ